jgi:hypothetical protein
MGHEVAEVLWSANESSNVPAAPCEPTTWVTRSRAAQATPVGTVVVVVETVDELPADVVTPVVVVELDGEEQATRPMQLATASATAPDTTVGRGRGERFPFSHRFDRCERRCVGCRGAVLRS